MQWRLLHSPLCVFLCERYNFQFIKRRFVWEFPQIRVSVVVFFLSSPPSTSHLRVPFLHSSSGECLSEHDFVSEPLIYSVVLCALHSPSSPLCQLSSFNSLAPCQLLLLKSTTQLHFHCVKKKRKKKIQTQTYKWAFLVCSCELKPVDLMWRRLHFCSAVLSSVSFSVLTSDQFINHTDSAAVEMMTIKTVSLLDRSPSNSCHSLWWRGNRFISSVSDTQISSR